MKRVFVLSGIMFFLALIIPIKIWANPEPDPNSTGERPKLIISGYVKDQTTGEALIGASVYIKEKTIGCVTNLYGFYSLSVDAGQYTVSYAYIGYETQNKQVTIKTDVTLNVDLNPNSEELSEVVVKSEKPDAKVTTTQMGMEKLQSKTIKSVPVLFGEIDPIKVIQMLPGVAATSEGSSGFSVRGGNPDQNLILLDEAIVYNAGHMMGFFSVFNNDALKDVQLYKGDIPANYGGRLASVLDVRMRDGNNKKFSGNGGIGLISSRLTLEGPVFSEKTSFIVSGRRSYLDLFLPFASDKSVRDNTIYFYDFNAKVNHTINENNRVYASGYFGRDVFKNGPDAFDFGNQTFTARWNHVFTPRLFSNFTFINSNYDYEIGSQSDGTDGFIWNSQLTDYSLKLDFNYYLNTNNNVSFGAQTIYHRINPGFARGTGEDPLYNEVQMPYNRSLENAIYVSNTQKLNNVLSLRYGLRYTWFQNMGSTTAYQYDDQYKMIGETQYGSWEVYNTFANLEPRIGITCMVDPHSSVKGSYARTVQYLQMASNSTSGSPLDVWFPASPNVKPQISDQYSVGFFRNLRNNTIETSVEVFYKDMDNVVDFKDHANLLLNKYLEGEIRSGKGYSYGTEFMARLNEERINGWVSYTYSRAYRKVEGIVNGDWYRSPYDRPHNVSIVLNGKVSQRGQLSVNWVYSTGQPMTTPVGRMEVGGNIMPIYSSRNAQRMPDYHRLDIGYTLKCRNRNNHKWQGEWNFSVYNAYGRHNAWMIGFEQDEDNPQLTKATRTYLFSIIPSVTYNFKF